MTNTKSFLCLIIVFFVCSCSLFKKVSEINLEADFVLAQEIAQEIKIEDLMKHLYVLSSDSLEGRETTKPGQKKAAEYIKNQFIKDGIYPTKTGEYYQKFNVSVTDFNRATLSLNNQKLELISDFYLFGNTHDTLISNADVVDVGFGIVDQQYDDYQNLDVQNKVVIIQEGLPPNINVSDRWENWRKKQKVATEKGALAVITVKKNYQSSIDRIAPFLLYPQMRMHKDVLSKATYIPNFCISKTTYLNYKKELNLTASFSVDINYEAETENVLGYIEGSQYKDELLVISAHYDHIGFDNGEVCNGADDDGSGTVCLLSLAKAFSIAKQKGYDFKRSILFLAVSGEEKGLFGSRYYTDYPIYPLENTIADLNIDMVGRIDTIHTDMNYIYLIGSDKISMDLHNISEKVNQNYIKMDLDYRYNKDSDPNKFYYRSDHYNFAKNDIPVIFYFSGIHNDYHKPTDDFEKINFDKLHLTAKYVFFTAWELINRDKKLK